MAAGDRLLDSTGNLVLDSTGAILLSSGITDYCCLKQVRKCSDNSFAGLYISKAKLPDPAADYYFKRSLDSLCYKALAADPFVTCNSGLTEVGTVTTVASCADSACGPSTTTGCGTDDGLSPVNNPPTGTSSTYLVTWTGDASACPAIFWPDCAPPVVVSYTGSSCCWDGTAGDPAVGPCFLHVRVCLGQLGSPTFAYFWDLQISLALVSGAVSNFPVFCGRKYTGNTPAGSYVAAGDVCLGGGGMAGCSTMTGMVIS